MKNVALLLRIAETKTMSCTAYIKSKGKKLLNETSCVICYMDGKTQILKTLKNGFEYKKCMPVVECPDDPCSVQPMSDPAEKIFGHVMCYVNLTEAAEDEVCEQKILCGARFDMNLVPWNCNGLELTKDDLKMISRTHHKPCYDTRQAECIELPDYLEGDKTAEKK